MSESQPEKPKPHEVQHTHTEEQERMIRFVEATYKEKLGEDLEHIRKPGGPEYIHQKHWLGKEMPPFDQFQERYLKEQPQVPKEEIEED